MANATIASQVQALYVGYLGRAADQAGLDFWANAIEAGTSTIESVALGFTLSAEYTSLYAGKTNEELAAAIYENVLGRAADADGLAFWVGELAKGVQTPETLLAAMLNSLGAIDQQVISNKVFVANAYTAAAGPDYDSVVGAKILEGVDGTAASVAAALNTVPAINSAGLTAALTKLDTANQALSSFLKSLDLNKNGKADVGDAGDGNTEQQQIDAVEALIDAAVVGQPIHVFNTSLFASVLLAATSTAAQQASAFAAARANAQNAIDTQQAVVDAKQAVVTALKDSADVTAYQAALTAAKASEKALDAANLSLEEAVTLFTLAKYAGLAASVEGLVALNGNNVVATSSKVVYGAADSDLIVWDAALNAGKGAFKIATAVTEAAVGKASDSTEAKLVVEATKVLGAVQAAYDANVADAKADAAVITKAGLVGDGTSSATAGYGAVDALNTEKAILETTIKNLSTLETAITELKAAYALNAQLTALTKAVETAEAAFETAGWDLNDAAGGANDKDIWVAGSDDLTIGNFGAGDLLFVGTDYSLVTLGAGQTLAGNLGSSSKLEIFWDAANSKLYIEEKAFAGNSAATETADTVVIELTGVTADLQLVNGYIQLA